MIPALDAEVAAALEHAGLRASACLDVTTIRFPTLRRATYRIELDSGETIKARCVRDESSARRLFEIRRHLPDAFVPAFDRHGRVLLERWVHGQPLDQTQPDESSLVEAGALLARLHAMSPVVAGQTAQDDSTSAWRLTTEDGLRTLVEAGTIEAQEADRLGRALAQSDPGRAVVGLGHFDFCGENMVIDNPGRLHVVDNERVSVGFLGLDLARTWYRWGLPADAWTVFQNAYAAASRAGGPPASLDFWSVVAVVQSACLRLHVDRSYLAVPVGKLRRMAAAADGGAPR